MVDDEQRKDVGVREGLEDTQVVVVGGIGAFQVVIVPVVQRIVRILLLY